jgi:uncharacterized Zn finger protein (UPF0148 family)
MAADYVDLCCPECGRFLAEVKVHGRAVCPHCGCEVTYRSKEERRRAAENAEKEPAGKVLDNLPLRV